MPPMKRKAGPSNNKAKRQRVFFRKSLKKRFTRAAKNAVIDGALGYVTGGPAGAIVGGVGGAASGFMKKVKGKKMNRVSTYVEGKFGKKYKKQDFKPAKKKMQTPDGKLTKLGMCVKGLHMSEEIRHTSETGGVGPETKIESVRVGHTTMPSRSTLYAVSRALVKLLFSRHQIKDFTDDMYGPPYRYNALDTIAFTYYADWTTNVLFTKSYVLPAQASYQFDELAQQIYGFFNDELRINGPVERTRLQELSYQPASTTSSFHEPVIINLQRVSIDMILESRMKVQNRTVTVATDNEQDDVNNVPLIGKIYHCKGNNLFDRNNRKILTNPTTSPASAASVDLYLYEGITSNRTINVALLNGQYTTLGPDNSTKSKPAEPPHPYQFLNCTSASKVELEPGAITESKISQKFKLPLKVLINILTSDYATLQPNMTFNPKKGLCRVMQLEKNIGSLASDVVVRTEVQWDCWVAATRKKDANYTNDIAIQIDINT